MSLPQEKHLLQTRGQEQILMQGLPRHPGLGDALDPAGTHHGHALDPGVGGGQRDRTALEDRERTAAGEDLVQDHPGLQQQDQGRPGEAGPLHPLHRQQGACHPIQPQPLGEGQDPQQLLGRPGLLTGQTGAVRQPGTQLVGGQGGRRLGQVGPNHEQHQDGACPRGTGPALDTVSEGPKSISQALGYYTCIVCN